jgi:hypothetical protein
MDYKKKSSKICCARKRADIQVANGTPGLKAIHLKRQSEAMAHAVQLDLDVEDVSHSKPAWIGTRGAESASEDGMAGRIYSAQEILDLIGKEGIGMRYINWGGMFVFSAAFPT